MLILIPNLTKDHIYADMLQLHFLNKPTSDDRFFVQLNHSSCTELYLIHQNIESLDPAIWLQLSPLEVLIMKSNKLNNIEPQSFTNLSQLTTLDLSYNNIQHLHEDSFNELVNLEDLNLNNVFFAANIHQETFSRLSKLRKLSFCLNKQGYIGKNMFANNAELEDLTILQVTDTNADSIDQLAFRPLGKLKSIWLELIPVRRIGKHMFSSNHELEVLRMQSCGTQKIHRNAFQNSRSLKKLFIIENGIILPYAAERLVQGLSNIEEYLID
jgi:hypothetical protein